MQIGSHYHFFEANRVLDFDRSRALGMRLNVPAGQTSRFEAGDEREVELVEYGGARRVIGFSGITDGAVTARWTAERALERVRDQGFTGAAARGESDASASDGAEERK